MSGRALCLVLLAAGHAAAGLRSESWGAQGKLTHPGTLKAGSAGTTPRLRFDLSAVPAGAKVVRAWLHVCAAQPREPIRLFVLSAIEGGAARWTGKPLEVGGPYDRSLDLTEAAAAWVADPKANLGLAIQGPGGGLAKSVLWVQFHTPQEPTGLPPQAEGLAIVHRHGQTFLRWKEVPAYRPPPEAARWVRHVGKGMPTTDRPGEGSGGAPMPAAITLQTLRDLQGLAVRDTPVGQWAREMPPFKRLRDVPGVAYRIYRHTSRITPQSLPRAERVGEVPALASYQQSFIRIKSHGEYYAPYEDATSVLPTWTLPEGKPLLPGEACFVYTPSRDAQAFYAVTTVQDGTENIAALSDANASAAVAETRAEPQPVLQWIAENKTRYGNSSAAEHWFAYWLAPPCANVPDNTPRRIVVGVPKGFKEPGPLVVATRAGMGPGWKVDNIDKAYLHIEQDVPYGGDLCYHSGRGTLRSYRQGAVDYYSDRYVTRIVNWVLGRWRIDRSRITANVGTHYGIRHPELFPILWNAPYAVDYNQRWNPARYSLDGRLGPRDLARTVDGHRAWDAFDIRWYLLQNPGKDIPFWVHDINGKESGHNVEYGWQDDAQGQSALRDARQPHVVRWGGHVSREVIDGLRRMSWTTSVPAFSNCSLDSNPGNGDPADGDPWGQINGFLFWDTRSIVDKPGRWEITVYLTADCFADRCTVDVTPRHLKAFSPKPGERFRWSNTPLGADRPAASGTVAADKWGLVTLEGLAVAKARNRVVVARDRQ